MGKSPLPEPPVSVGTDESQRRWWWDPHPKPRKLGEVEKFQIIKLELEYNIGERRTRNMEGTATLLPEIKSNYGKLRNYINGEWVDSESTQIGDIVNPAKGEIIAQVPFSTRDEAERAVRAASNAFWEWRETPAATRVRYFFRLKNLLEEHFEELARILTQHEGKEIDQARGEIRRGIESVEFACGIPALMQGYNSEDVARGIDETAILVPMGVFGGVTPFNFPFLNPAYFMPTAVACGNTFISKPSEVAPVVANRLFELIDEADFPPGVTNLVHGRKEVVDVFADHPDVKGVGFIGSTPVGQAIYKACGEKGKRACCQAGAKNFMVVMPDADLDRTITALMTSFYGCTGQRCLSGSVLVPVGDVYEALKEKFVEAASRMKVGYGLDETTQMGPVVTRASLERILDYIDIGLKEGGKLILDGRNIKVEGYPNGNWLGPNVFDEVRPDMTIAQEEIFGPVASIVRAKDLDEALKICNASRFGNASAIFTSSGKTAREFAYKIGSGNVGVNIGIAAPVSQFAFGGMKDSFFGVLHGQKDMINFFTDKKVVINRWF